MRIQIIELPHRVVGEAVEQPYAVVVSEIPIDMTSTEEGEHSSAAIAAQHWGQKIRDGGAAWVIFTADEVGPKRATNMFEPVDALLRQAEAGIINGG